MRAVLNQNNGLFTGSEDSPTVQPNPISSVNPDHLEYFKFVGRVVGKALADGHLLDVHFTRSFYKHMLGVPITYHVRHNRVPVSIAAWQLFTNSRHGHVVVAWARVLSLCRTLKQSIRRTTALSSKSFSTLWR